MEVNKRCSDHKYMEDLMTLELQTETRQSKKKWGWHVLCIL